jgi:outer membrane protein assembly factor BamB
MGAEETYLIDMLGNVVHTWPHETKPPGLHFVLLENGHILGNTGTGMHQGPGGPNTQEGDGQDTTKWNLGGAAKGLIEMDWDGNVVWEWEPGPEDGTHHHDFVKLPNGNILCNIWETVSYEKAIAAGRRADQTTEKGVAVDVIYEIDPEGRVVWKWNAWDYRGTNSEKHLDVNYITYVLPEHGQNNPDWNHFNDVDYDPATDRILVDSREFGELYIIDHKTGDILYRWGNPSAYGAGAPPTLTTPGDQILFGPHDAHWIDEGLPGAGNILIFNNGWARAPITYSSVIEMNPETGEIVWEYKSNAETGFSSHHISGAQRLPNGNTLICSGNNGHIFEVTADKEVVWEYINPITSNGAVSRLEDAGMMGGNAVFRAHRYGPDHPGLKGKDLTPRGQIAEDVKAGWQPKVNLEGATQPGGELWEKIWE